MVAGSPVPPREPRIFLCPACRGAGVVCECGKPWRHPGRCRGERRGPQARAHPWHYGPLKK